MQTSKSLTLRRNFSWTFIGNAVYAACQWGMLVVIAKLGSPEMVGQFTLGLAVTAPVFMFTNLQLRNIQATDAKQEYLFSDYLGLRLISTGLSLLVILIITLISGYRWEISLIILLIGLAKAVESISDVFYGLIQNRERMDIIARSMMIKGILSLLILSISIYLSSSIVWGAFSLVITWSIVLLVYDIYSSILLFKNFSSASPTTTPILDLSTTALQPSWNWTKLKQLVWLALPLGFVMMLISLNHNVPRYFIEQYLGERELGFFAAIAYLMVAGRMVVSALGQSASPRLARYYATGNSSAFRQLIIKSVIIGILLGGTAIIVALIAGENILTLIYQPEYAQYADLFAWVMVAAGISYVASFLGYGMTAARYFRIQMPLFFLSTAASTIACFWLIPIFKLQGAAIALILAESIQAVMGAAVVVHALYKINRQTL